MKRVKVSWVLATITALAVGAIATTGIDAAVAAQQGSPTPAIEEGGHNFYSDDQIQQAWNYATAHFPYALPNGVTFPSSVPLFFRPGDGKQHLFETALPMMIAAKYYRCAWLDVELSTSGSASTTAQLNADQYQTIPEVKANLLGASSFGSAFAEIAAQDGVSPQAYELKYDCGILAQN